MAHVPNRWVGGGPVGSPDLNTLVVNFYGARWKQLTRELIAHIEQDVDTIKGKPLSLLRACTDSQLRRAQLCVDQAGSHFEQFLNSRQGRNKCFFFFLKMISEKNVMVGNLNHVLSFHRDLIPCKICCFGSKSLRHLSKFSGS